MSVRLINISKEFSDPEREGGKVRAVRDFNLEIAEGEFVTLLGPSGCGKTTTLRIIAGFETPTKGEVWINGKNVNNDPPNKRDTSMVFQSYAIFSGGQQQRVALARSIINKPSVLLFDEPLSNLDAKLREQMRVEIRRIQQTFKITSVYVTHDQVEAMTVSDRVVVMDKGCMMQVGTPFEIYSRPSNRFVADFIGKVNLLPVRFEREDSGRYLAQDARGMRFEAMSAVPGLEPDQEALFMLRPESIYVESEESASSSGPLRMILAHGIIDKAVYLGSTVEYEIDVSLDRPMLAVSHDPVNAGFWRPGDAVVLKYSPRAAHLLPFMNP